MKTQIIISLILQFSFLQAQSCDELKEEGVNHGISIFKLERLVDSGCDKAKLTLAHELYTGYRVEKDSTRAVKLLEDCQNTDLDCKYELFQINYNSEPEKAYQYISEIALDDSFSTFWDSAAVFSARVISAAMIMDTLITHEDLSTAGTWWLLAYEIKDAWYDYPVEGILEDMDTFFETLSKRQKRKAFKAARSILGYKPSYKLEK